MRKNKNKKIFFVFILLALAGFFGLRSARANSHLIINEVQITGGSGKTTNDFIEIYNPTGNKINLKDYRMVKRTKTGTADTNVKSWTSDTYIKSHDYYLWANSGSGFAEGIGADASTTESIASDNGIAIRKGDKDTGEIVDSVGWGDCQNAFVEKEAYPENPGANESLERKDFKDTDDNSADFGISEIPTPMHSQADSDSDSGNGETESKDYSGKVRINEIYPAPITKEGETEFVEIKNSSGEDIDFSGWCLKDKTENDKGEKGSCKKIAKIEKAGDFYVLYGTFSLNNDTKGDSVFLYDSGGILVDSQPYQSTESGYSYAYDEQSSAWRWTSKKTPGEKNGFDKIISGKIQKDDPVYVGVYANFSVDSDNDAEKFTWDFGDGHKSYLKDTKHKYEKTGEYSGSLKITGNGEASQYFFTVKVEKYKAPKVRISSFSPNPKGIDTKKEYIVLENKSKKKINLKDWSVAMGWDNLVNHPIREDFILKPGKSKKLTQKICAFSLNNTKTKIELRDPSGKVVQKIKYDRTKNKIEEDEIYQSGEWLKPQTSEDLTTTNADIQATTNANNTQNNIENNNSSGEINNAVNVSPEEIQASLGKFSENPDYTAKKEYKIVLLGYNTSIKSPVDLANSSRVAGAFTERNILPSQKHWAVELIDGFWMKINSGMNWVLNKIL